MSSAHAILSPSGASKWLNCTPSARFEATLPDKTGDEAREGTLAHSLGELIIVHRSNRITNKKFREQLAAIESNPMYNKGMYEYCDGYALYTLEQFAVAQAADPAAEFYVEQKLDMGTWVPEGFGTGDFGIYGGGVIDIIDLKYGKGVPVSAVDNKQLRIYALGWTNELGWLHDIHTVRMHIYQPRLNSVTVDEVSYADLMKWATEELAPKAQLAFKGEGDYNAGRHCQFCRAKAVCKANAEFQVRIAAKDFDEFSQVENLDQMIANTPLMTLEELVTVLQKAEMFTNWLAEVKKHTLAEALKGIKYPGMKLVRAKGQRKFNNIDAMAKLLIKDGYDRNKIYEPQELVGITKIEALTGKKYVDSSLKPFIVKAPGAPALVDESHKGTAWDPVSEAAADFESLEADDLG